MQTHTHIYSLGKANCYKRNRKEERKGGRKEGKEGGKEGGREKRISVVLNTDSSFLPYVIEGLFCVVNHGCRLL